jgi:hypothetical protein
VTPPAIILLLALANPIDLDGTTVERRAAALRTADGIGTWGYTV